MINPPRVLRIRDDSTPHWRTHAFIQNYLHVADIRSNIPSRRVRYLKPYKRINEKQYIKLRYPTTTTTTIYYQNTEHDSSIATSTEPKATLASITEHNATIATGTEHETLIASWHNMRYETRTVHIPLRFEGLSLRHHTSLWGTKPPTTYFALRD